MRHARQRPKLNLVVWIALALVGCADPGSGSTGSDDPVRATVSIEYTTDDITLEFKPGALEFGADPWARHEVTVSIATDDYIQHVTLHDRYVIDGNSVAPASDALATEFAFSDQNAGSTFVIDVQDLSPGVHNFEMAIPVHLEPSPDVQGSTESRESVMKIEFRFDVFVETSPLVTFCARADQMLTESSLDFSPDVLIEPGADALAPEQVGRMESALGRFEAELEDEATIDPNEFFDLIEEFCGVSYPERWATTFN